jgi:hypothetical protein
MYSYPKQGAYLNARVRVCFNYNTQIHFSGVIIRDDVESDCLTIIKLDDGRIIMGTECQYQFI